MYSAVVLDTTFASHEYPVTVFQFAVSNLALTAVTESLLLVETDASLVPITRILVAPSNVT